MLVRIHVDTHFRRSITAIITALISATQLEHIGMFGHVITQIDFEEIFSVAMRARLREIEVGG